MLILSSLGSDKVGMTLHVRGWIPQRKEKKIHPFNMENVTFFTCGSQESFFFFPHIETAQGKFSGFGISPMPGWWKLNVTGGALNNQGPSGFGSGIKCSKNIIISFGPMRKDNASRAVEGTHSNK